MLRHVLEQRVHPVQVQYNLEILALADYFTALHFGGIYCTFSSTAVIQHLQLKIT